MGSRRGLAALKLAWDTLKPYTTGLEQDDPAKPIASAFGHFMRRQTPGVDEE